MAPRHADATELVDYQRTKSVSFAEDTQFEDRRRLPSNGSGNYGPDHAEDSDDDDDELDHAANVVRDSFGNLPAEQGLYNPDEEKDACG